MWMFLTATFFDWSSGLGWDSETDRAIDPVTEIPSGNISLDSFSILFFFKLAITFLGFYESSWNLCMYMGFTVSNGVPAIVSWGNSRRKKKNRGREGRLDATEKKRRGEAGKVSHQGSPNFKLLIHRQSSSAPKAFCYCHCPEDFAQEFEEQKKASWIHPLETLSPSSCWNRL